jgi:hypothetical protein
MRMNVEVRITVDEEIDYNIPLSPFPVLEPFL